MSRPERSNGPAPTHGRRVGRRSKGMAQLEHCPIIMPIIVCPRAARRARARSLWYSCMVTQYGKSCFESTLSCFIFSLRFLLRAAFLPVPGDGSVMIDDGDDAAESSSSSSSLSLT